MAKEIKVNDLAQGIDNAIVISVAVVAGDKLEAGDTIAEIESDKATMELKSGVEGYVKAVIAENGQEVGGESVLVITGEKDEKIDENYVKTVTKTGLKIPEDAPKMPKVDPKSTQKKGFNIACLSDKTPDLSKVKPGDTVELSHPQKIAGEKMVASKREIPCFYLTTVADVSELVNLREKLNSENKIKLSFDDFILKAMAGGVEKYPVMGGRLDGDMIVTQSDVNISISVAAGYDLFEPVIKSVQGKSVFEIAETRSLLVEKAQSALLENDDLENGCCCLSNLGYLGVDSFVPIVLPGQCFILGAGTIADTVVAEGRGNAIVKCMSMTISVDHRIANGAYAAQFLDFIKKMLENPESLI